MALPLPRDLFPFRRMTPPDTMSIVRTIALMPDDVVGLVRHLRRNTGD